MQQAIERLKYVQLAYLSKPTSLRPLFRRIRRLRATRIVEIGLHSPRLAGQMIAAAAVGRSSADVTYTAIDLFELRPHSSPPGVSLRLAYRQLASTGARIQLFPGQPHAVLAARANELLNRDLIVISGVRDLAALDRTWFYLPRMLHARSAVIQLSAEGETSQATLREIPRAELDVLAGSAVRRAA